MESIKDQYEQEVAYRQANIQRFRDHFNSWGSMYQEVQHAICAAIDTEAVDLGVTFDTDSLSISLVGTPQHLATLCRVLYKQGFRPDEKPGESQAHWYTWWHHTGDGIDAKLWVSFSSSVCRRIQVGTKLEEVPVYETHCGEAIEVPEAPPVEAA